MKNEFNESAGRAALDQLARYWAMHDGNIRALSVSTTTGTQVAVELDCVPRPESPVSVAHIRLDGVTRLDFSWNRAEEDFYLVPSYKALILKSGSVYLSLDPFDDTLERPDERDRVVFEAASVVVTLRMKTTAPQR